MLIPILLNGGAVILAVCLSGPAGRFFAAMDEYDAVVANSRYHRHREGVSVHDTLELMRWRDEMAQFWQEQEQERVAGRHRAEEWQDSTMELTPVH